SGPGQAMREVTASTGEDDAVGETPGADRSEGNVDKTGLPWHKDKAGVRYVERRRRADIANRGLTTHIDYHKRLERDLTDCHRTEVEVGRGNHEERRSGGRNSCIIPGPGTRSNRSHSPEV